MHLVVKLNPHDITESDISEDRITSVTPICLPGEQWRPFFFNQQFFYFTFKKKKKKLTQSRKRHYMSHIPPALPPSPFSSQLSNIIFLQKFQLKVRIIWLSTSRMLKQKPPTFLTFLMNNYWVGWHDNEEHFHLYVNLIKTLHFHPVEISKIANKNKKNHLSWSSSWF